MASRALRHADYATYAVLGVGALIMLLPFVWMVSTSLKPGEATFVMPPQLVPASPTAENYETIFTAVPMGKFLVNSILVSVVSTAIMVLNCAMAGYAFARIKFPGRET